jgi:hypothetical protein
MITSKSIVAALRAKKKKMEEEHSDAVKLSGIPMDKEEMDIFKRHEMGEKLSKNFFKERDEEPELEHEEHEEMKKQPHDMEEYDSKRVKMMAKGGMAELYPHEKHHMLKMIHEGEAKAEPMPHEVDHLLKLGEGGHVLDAEARKHIAQHNFALPGSRYPIHDVAHARNALSRIAQYGSEEEIEKVRHAVHKKYPHLAEEQEEHKAKGGMMASHKMDRMKMMFAKMGK